MTVILTELEKIGRCMGSGKHGPRREGGREGGSAPLHTGVALAARVVIIRAAQRRVEKL